MPSESVGFEKYRAIPTDFQFKACRLQRSYVDKNGKLRVFVYDEEVK